MRFDATPDPYANPIPFGHRLQILRTRRGLTREALGGLMGRSGSWVKGLESGRLKTPKLDVLLHLAEVLRVRDLSDLTGDQVGVRAALFTGPGHPRLAAVASAVDAFALTSDSPAPPTAHIEARISRAWAARHSAPNHREVLGGLLPGLIQDAQLAVRQSDRAAQRRSAQAALAQTYALAQFFLAYQPDPALLWRVAERGMVAAQESEDPRAIGVAAWLTAQAHREAGAAHYDAADAVTREALAYLEPMLPDADDDVLAVVGALRCESGLTAARRGASGTAWRYWDQADAIARRLPERYFHPVTSFSRAVMGAHAVTVAVELHAGGESVRQAAASDAVTIPSRPRRARHRIEEARAYHLDRQPDVALATLEQAHASAPETIKYNGHAKRIVLEEAEAKAPARRQRAAGLAVKLGLLSA
ncbi:MULTISPECIES: helix-turn-helix domain-containing protein [unclassified Streptomyces]|uniref:helix-turn-helix domain-containing protein n=1 Tax=unclassified Streptomyces TaxID=2593676 RepID=UPI000DAE481A|nr:MULTISPECIES: helix-turn-helix transcriptional regulator [unclassified Streptomyces]PZT76269.1 XRE family transcriptional regulator [Streptomyces sp. AC1-42W]PZT79776.1 XRE family transcriptional regulator [Streptomyces sp. AC1-42T]